LQIWLDRGGFYACVPDDSLKEDETVCSIISIDVLPAFGSIMSGTSGYMIYPDGCGALFDCENTQGKTGVFSEYVYSQQQTVPSNRTDKVRILSPWFGSCVPGNQGFAGYIAQGAQSAYISLSTGSFVLPLNRLFSSAVYRYPVVMTTSQGKEFTTLSKREANMNFTVRYSLLSGESVDYSEIAISIRDIMKSLSVLPEKKSQESTALALEIFMGIKQNGMLGKSDLTMTTWNQAGDMLDRLTQESASQIYTSLLGWQTTGYGVYPSEPKPSSVHGSAGELNRLLKKAEDTDNRILLQTNYQTAGSGGKFNISNDVVYNSMSAAITDSLGRRYLLNPLVSYKNLTSDLKRYKKTGAAALAFDALSDALPSDASENRAVSAGQAKAIYEKMLSSSVEQGFFNGVQTGNDYLLKYSDYVYNLPNSSSGSLFFTKELPIYQIILHGTVPYCGDIPGNMSPDFSTSRLKWAEYGCMPYFLVTHENTSLLKQTNMDDIFNSRFSDWQNVIAGTAKDFSSRLSPTSSEEMLRRTEPSEGLVKMEYSNKLTVYVNYTENSAKVSEGLVPAREFAVFKNGEEVR